MVKFYGSPLCPDCVACKKNFDENKLEYEYIDITASMRALKEFLKIRDNNSIFDVCREGGSVGIPALLSEDGEITIDWEGYLTKRGIKVVNEMKQGVACSIDGKGC